MKAKGDTGTSTSRVANVTSWYSREGGMSGRKVWIGVCGGVLVFVVGFVVSILILISVHNAVPLSVVGGVFGLVIATLAWNSSACASFVLCRVLAGFRSADLSGVTHGQYVKLTGVVSCGSTYLESSYEKISKCIYTSTSLYEHGRWDAKMADPKPWRFHWHMSYTERNVAEFYLTDSFSGLRAFIKPGDESMVIPYIEETSIVDFTNMKKDISQYFFNWLRERNLPVHRRKMCLKEGYITEGTVVSVFGIVQRQDDVLTIVPPIDSVSTGCQWKWFFLPVNIEGMVILCNDNSVNRQSLGQ